MFSQGVKTPFCLQAGEFYPLEAFAQCLKARFRTLNQFIGELFPAEL